MIRTGLILTILVYAAALYAQQPTKTIRGKVTDEASGIPLPYVNVHLPHTGLGSITDDNGDFELTNVPIGRYDIMISFIGYESVVLKEIQVTSGKEVYLNVSMKEITTTLDEITIRAKTNKEQPLNSMATVSARMLSVEEARRFAGGFDDPARLVSAFAGVSSNGVSSNAIVVRGNSPQSLQWKMEGVEIPNPNHFADLATFGGGGLTALSAQLLANSDFFSGAMPAEYGNALSGVFDIFMRTGNKEKHEHTFQVGVIGIDAAMEGPFKKDKQSSYIFNYRYSTLGLLESILPENAGGTNYQDLSFKLNFPTKMNGTFSVWGIGLIDRSSATAKTDINAWKYYEDRENSETKQFMGAGGFSYRISLHDSQFLKTTLAATVNGIDMKTDRMDRNFSTSPQNEIQNRTYNIVLSAYLNTKFSARHTNKTGVVATNLNYDLLLRNVPSGGNALQTFVNENGNSYLLNFYSNSKIDFGDKITANAGVNTQLFTFNNALAIEPRAGINYRLASTQSLSIAYGLHSRLERVSYYFIKDQSGSERNKSLGFTKAHHWVMGYDISLSEFTHLKAETYYQYLFDVPVTPNTTFSMINQLNDWFFDGNLENKGKGRNYGLDITFEKYLSKGFYYLATASVFQSEYKVSDNIWRNTRYNRNYAFNFLIGKEWMEGKDKSNVFSLNARFSLQGGDRYSPVNTAQSIAEEDPVFDEVNAFSRQFSPVFTNHLTASYKLNKRKSTHELALKIINTTMYKEFQGFRYNFASQSIDQKREVVFFPNLSYKIDF